MLNDTICAISTALNNGAISIVRMSGEDAFKIIQEIAHLKETQIQKNHIIYGHIYDAEEMIDEVLISFFKGPRSFTAEDMVEINCHGGIYVTRAILNLLLAKGARLAEAGEFTKRAYLNGRIDLTEAESINDLIQATTKTQAKSAIKGVNGSIERLLNPLMKDLKDTISMIEVNIDYPEYDDVEIMTNEKVLPKVHQWINDFAQMIDKAERFRVIKDGIQTVIVGKPNVGKSSLLNALLEKEKAIVTDIAGTTRDLVEDTVQLKNITLHLIDTAGIRQSEDVVEKIGIERSKEALKEAELVILVLDGSNELDHYDQELLKLTEDKNRIIVYNKKDLKESHEGICISAKDNDIKELVDYIENIYAHDAELISEDLLNNERQIALMKKAQNSLKNILEDIELMPLDVVGENIIECYRYLSDILGREYKEDLIDHMFKNFCLGK